MAGNRDLPNVRAFLSLHAVLLLRQEVQRQHELAERERQEYLRQTEAERQKYQAMWDQKQEQKKSKHYAMCQDVLMQVLHVAENVVDYCERTGENGRTYPRSHLVPKPLWKQWMTMFLNGQQLQPEPDDVAHTLQEGEEPPADEAESDITQLLNDAELKDYLSFQDEWFDPEAPRIDDQYNRPLMELMYRLQKITQPDPPGCRPEPAEKVRIVLIGKPLSGKSVIAKECAKEMDLVYISPTSIIEEATQPFSAESDKAAEALPENLKNLYTEFLTLGRQIRRQLLDGKEVDEVALIPLVMNRLKFMAADSTNQVRPLPMTAGPPPSAHTLQSNPTSAAAAIPATDKHNPKFF